LRLKASSVALQLLGEAVVKKRDEDFTYLMNVFFAKTFFLLEVRQTAASIVLAIPSLKNKMIFAAYFLFITFFV
jgi:hypothetical protein